MSYPLPDAAVLFALKARVRDIVTKTRYSLVLAHAAVDSSSEVDLTIEGCPGRYSYGYKTAHVSEVLLAHRDGSNIPGSKPRAWEGVKAVNLMDVQKQFDADDRAARERLAEAMAAPVDEVSPVVPPIIDEASPVDEEIVKLLKGIPEQEAGKKGHTGDSRYCPKEGDMRSFGHKRKGVHLADPVIIDAPTEMGVVVADAVSKDETLAKD